MAALQAWPSTLFHPVLGFPPFVASFKFGSFLDGDAEQSTTMNRVATIPRRIADRGPFLDQFLVPGPSASETWHEIQETP